MKKWIIVLFAIISLCFVVFLGGYLYPYHLYFKALKGDIHNSYFSLKIKRITKAYYPHEYYRFDYADAKTRMNFWKPMVLQNISILMPTAHPYLKPRPYIVSRINGRRLKSSLFGFKVVKQVDKKLVEFLKYEFVGQKSFDLHLNGQKLFRLPILKKIILARSEKQIWKDMFTLDIRIDGESEFSVGSILKYKDHSYEELAYKAYIFFLRTKYFSKRSSGFEFNPDNGVGRVLIGQTDSFIKEVYYQLESGQIYIFGLSSRKKDASVSFFRDDFFRRIAVRDSSLEDLNDIYLTFKSLSKEEKLTPLGYSYLYSDLSLREPSSEEEFLKKIIQFIERDTNAYYFLEPLYAYALERYKRTFSLSSTFIDQDEMIKLRRNIDLEIDKEVKEVKEKKIVAPENEFKNDEEQIDFYLNSTKDKFVPIDDEMNL